jgi:phosphoribosylformylglycinamidine cyclo-ligase
VLEGWDLNAPQPELGRSLGDALLEPHRSYLPHIQRLHAAGVPIKGLAHITGGGLVDNPPRILPDGVALHLHRDSWPIPPLFQLIQRAGRIDDHEMAHVFNLGLGMLVVVPADQTGDALEVLEDAWLVGEAVHGKPQCIIL